MNHLVQPFGHVSMPQALERLREAHGFLVARGKLSALVSSANESWGIDNKRTGSASRSSTDPRTSARSLSVSPSSST